MSKTLGDNRRTLQVTHTIDVPADVTDKEIAEVFPDMRVHYLAIPWLVSLRSARNRGSNG
jgi:hypothetical protein